MGKEYLPEDVEERMARLQVDKGERIKLVNYILDDIFENKACGCLHLSPIVISSTALLSANQTTNTMPDKKYGTQFDTIEKRKNQMEIDKARIESFNEDLVLLFEEHPNIDLQLVFDEEMQEAYLFAEGKVFKKLIAKVDSLDDEIGIAGELQ